MMFANTESIEDLLQRQEELLKKRQLVLTRHTQPGTSLGNDNEVFPRPSTSNANQTVLIEFIITTITLEKDFSDVL